MKRPIFIIVGTILVLVLLAIWLYVLFFGTPKNNPDTFADLNFEDTTDSSVNFTDNNENNPSEQPTVDVAGPERLRQLTTKPVVGYQEVRRDASSTPEIVYVEAGTGHIFSIDSLSGEETRISGTTLKESMLGAITPNGRFMMIQSSEGGGREFVVGELSTTSETLNTIELDERIIDFKATTNNTFLYAVQTDSSVIGKHYYPISDTSETIFTVPFREAIVEWGNTALESQYVYPKASSKLEGYLYQFKNEQMKRLPIDGFGLSASGNESIVVYSEKIDNSYQTSIYDLEDGVPKSSPIAIIPEKCTSKQKNPSRIICATSLTTYKNNIPDAWYQGIVSYTDDLWEIEIDSLNNLSLRQIVSPEYISGRQLDIINLTVNSNDSSIYFLNKNDRTLWLYELDPDFDFSEFENFDESDIEEVNNDSVPII